MPVLTDKMFKIWYKFEPLFKLTESYQIEQKHIVNGALGIVNEVIQEKEKNFVPDIPEPEPSLESSDGSSKMPLIFIDQLYKKRDVLSTLDIHDEVITFIVTVSLKCFINEKFC